MMLLLALSLTLFQQPDTLAGRIERLVKPYVGAGMFSGVVRTSMGGNVRYERAFGLANVEHGVPVQTDTRFRVASLSKPITAAAIGTLIRDRTLALDDTIATWFPAFPNAERITVRQLVAHRSGIPHINDLPWYLDRMTRDFPLDSLVAWIADEGPAFPPDSAYEYSNGGYAMLAALIERVTRARYIDYVQRAVFVPLGMQQSGEEQPQEVVPRLADGYQPGRGARDLARSTYVATSIKVGGGSLYSTAGDLERFVRAIGQEALLPAALWSELLGSSPVLYFSGRAPGYNSVVMYDRRTDAVVAVLSNNYAISANSLAAPIMGMLTDGAPPLAAFGELRSDDAAAARAFAGRYLWPPPFDNAFTLQTTTTGLLYDPDGRVDERSGSILLQDGRLLIRMYDARCRRAADGRGLSCDAPWAPAPLLLQQLPAR